MEKVKEFISYGIVGVMTTLVNYMVYFICLDTFNKLGYKAKINTHTTSYIN